MSGGVFRSGPKVGPEQRLRDFARVQVRAGLLDDPGVRREVADAVVAESSVPPREAGARADQLVDEARSELAGEVGGWARPTDHDRLQQAFAELATADVAVLQGVDDHWAAAELLRGRAHEGRSPRGVVWFTAPDVWHAVDHGMLELNVWHGDSANVAPGEPLLDLVTETLHRHGLSAHFDEGRIEVGAYWHNSAAAHFPDLSP